MRNLTKDKLSNYVENNQAYYENYREKFNKKNNFFSWNWSLFFFIPWLAYRKIWVYYFGYVVLSIAYSITFYYFVVDFRSVSSVWMIILGLGALFFIFYSMLTANSQVLKRASVSNITHVKSKSSWIVVLGASIVLVLPFLYTLKSLYPLYKFHQDRNAIYHFPEKETNILKVLEKINEISNENVNAMGVYAEIGIISKKDLIDIVVCYDNVMLLDRLKEKGALFFESHLSNAVKCNALKSVTFLLDQNVSSIGKDEKDDFNNFSKYRLVQHPIYKENLSMAKLLLSKKNHIMGANAQVLIMDAFSIKDPIKKKELIEYLLSKKIDIYNTLETNETSALREAVANHDYNSTKLLLENGANPNQRFKHRRTILHDSLYSSDIKMMQLLLEYKANVNNVLYDGLTILNHALRNKDAKKFKLLLDNNATLDVKDFINRYASGSTDATSLEFLYMYYDMPTLENKDIVALFQKACELKSTKAVDVLLSKGYDINTTSSDSAYPYVAHVCYGWKDTDMFEYVISKGANVNVYRRGNDHGRDLLQNTISRNSEKVFTKESWKRLKLILAHGANVNHQDDGNKTTLMWADSYPNVVQYLLDNAYVDFKLLDDKKESILHYSYNKPDIMQIIIKKLQKDAYLLDQQNIYGNTPLHYAASESYEVVKILLEAGSNPNIVNNAGYTAQADVKDKKSYELLKNTGNKISKSKAKCTIHVGILGKKEYQGECLKVAEHQTETNSITYFQFLGGDIKNLIKTDFNLTKKGKRAYMYAYGNVGHGYIINKEFGKAKKSYEEFLGSGWTWNITIEDSDKEMKKDLDIMSKLYGEVFKNKALKIWKEVKGEHLYYRYK